MEKIWLASNYYLDPKLAGCSASVERMFTRLLAYCGSLETRGKLPPKPWTFVGLPNGKRSTFELVSRGILRELPGGSFEFPAWSGWQDSGDELAERRRRDRERKRAARLEASEASADVSADFQPLDKKREERTVCPADTAKPEAVEQSVTRAAYEELGKAFNFIAVRGIVKWAIHDRGAEPEAVRHALVAIHQGGRPITKQTVDQHLSKRSIHNRDPKSGLLVER